MISFKRLLAMSLIVTILITTIPVEVVANQEESIISTEIGKSAEEVESTEEKELSEDIETIESVEDTELIEDTQNIENIAEIEDIQELENIEEIESTEYSETTEEVKNNETDTEIVDNTEYIQNEVEVDSTEVQKSTEQDSETTTKDKVLIEYLVLSESNVTFGTKQEVVIGLGCGKVIELAVLQYHNQETGEVFQQQYTEFLDGALLFELEFASQEQSGTYQLDTIFFQVEGKEYGESFLEAGIEAVFGVNQEIIPESDAVIEDGSMDDVDVDTDIVRIDEDGNTISETSMEEAIENARAEQPAVFDLSHSQNMVVVLDPGHDNTHAGAQGNGLGEEDLNLKIAAYCKEELEQYNGVIVYLTRALDGSCPYPGTTTSGCNEKRVAYAQSVGANIYVSLHNNSSTNKSAHGGMVFYPNKNYNPSVSETGKGLAQQIQDQLVSLGIYDRGITIKDSQDNTTYPDGSLADYYGVIRNSKLAGIPAIIVEHAFISNTNDVNNFLISDEKLKQLGVTDASALATYYELTKEVNVTAADIRVLNLDNDSGTAIMTVLNVEPKEKIDKVSFAVWAMQDQRDLVWYDAINSDSKNYQALLDISKHKYNYGNYYIDAYAYDIYGNSHYIGRTMCEFTVPQAEITVIGDNQETNYSIVAKNIAMAGEVKQTKVAVWSQINGQDDLIWYEANKNGTNDYTARVSILNHRAAGLYYADIYIISENGVAYFVGRSTFEVSKPTIEKMEIINKKDETGTFEVVLTGVRAAAGISKIQIPVWSQEDQADLYWYIAEMRSDGSYVATINIANHQYNYDDYRIDVYVTANNDICQYVGGTVVSINVPMAKITASESSSQTRYLLEASDVVMAGGAQKVKFAVWSQTNGQDDLVWYEGTENISGAYVSDVIISNHKTAGLYYIDAYAIGATGKSFFLGRTTFNVAAPTVKKIEIINKNECEGTFNVVLSGVQVPSGVSKIQVPVWSKDDQSDLYWYNAEMQSDGSYITKVDITNHKYNYATYRIDVYVTAQNGICQYVGGRAVTIEAPIAKVSAMADTTQMEYTLIASNVGIQNGVKKVRFAVWSQINGQDDLIWYNGSNSTVGTWKTKALILNHKTAGTYFVDAYVEDLLGKYVFIGRTTFEVKEPTVGDVVLSSYNESDGTFSVCALDVESMSGIAEVKVAVWSSGNQSDLVWYDATKVADGVYQVGVDIRNHQNNTGRYYSDVYVSDNNGIQVFAGRVVCTIVNVTNTLHPIMGSSSVAVSQMVNFFKLSAVYPNFYADTEAVTIEEFCRIYLEECQAEGVKAEVAFCQAMKETRFLQFGGNVSIEQFNFAGLGSTGVGIAGESYSDVRTGIRAQVQHLKAYGSTEPLNQLCVDNRFNYVTRNTAPYVEWLGIQENPYGKGWATAEKYGYDIVNMVNKLKMY